MQAASPQPGAVRKRACLRSCMHAHGHVEAKHVRCVCVCVHPKPVQRVVCSASGIAVVNGTFQPKPQREVARGVCDGWLMMRALIHPRGLDVISLRSEFLTYLFGLSCGGQPALS